MQLVNDDGNPAPHGPVLLDPDGVACALAPVRVGALVNGTTFSLPADGTAAHGLAASADCAPAENDDPYARYTLTLRNDGDDALTIDDLYLDLGVAASAAGADSAAGTAPAGGSAEPLDTPDAYLLLPYAGQSERRLLVMPYDTTQFDLCEPLALAGTSIAVRCYLRAAARRHAAEYATHHWVNPARSFTLAPHRAASFTLLLAFAASEHDAASFLVRFAETPLGYEDGANGMQSLYHFLLDDPKSIHASRDMVNGSVSATITDGRLASLTTPTGGIEAIDPDMGFGDASVTYADGRSYSTIGQGGHRGEHGESVFRDGPLTIGFDFALDGGTLRYTLGLSNTGDAPVRLDDVNIPVPLNSRMAWGVDASQRMIRHTQVAGDNSFFLATPSDGKPPYLLCVPGGGMRWELFDMAPLPDRTGAKRDMYRIHLYGAGAAAEAATHEGGRWRLPTTSLTLGAGESRRFVFDLLWVPDYDQARAELVRHGKLDVQAVPGYTLPRDAEARILVDSRYENVSLTAEHPDSTAIRMISERTDESAGVHRRIFGVRLDRLGENLLTLHYGDGKVGWLEMFSTLPVGELIESRADYIARCQKNDPDVWYDGLLQERNTRTGALLNPDNYDEIKGWRIYEVTCDDPGLSKPAFLAAKNAERPVESQVRALDRYLTKFVWGGLQRTDAEEWPYGVYGVPDWKNLRDQRNLNGNEQLHIGRLWDFPHVALAWFMMYRIAVRNPQWVSLPATEYLKRAWGTFVAMYRYPDEVGYDYESKLDNTTPYKTGYYNELVIADVIDALRAEGETTKAAQLDAYWNHKADFLIHQAKDLFGSEYAFDTTGFETTQAVVDWGRGHAMRVWNTDGRSVTSYRAGDVERFDRYQRACNVACRGWLENGFYITGSDIRNDTMQYTLSYMSQMGGWSLLEDALYADGSPFKLLRLAYASLLSSWALINAGDEESDYGYWFPGAANQGASSGGFEPLPYATTWLGQPADRGYWIYGCETDLGYCGYLRGASLVVADDPDFGRVVYGGVETARQGAKAWDDPAEGTRVTRIAPTDGVNRQLHLLRSDTDRVHVLLADARFAEVTLEEFGHGRTAITLEIADAIDGRATLRAFTHDGTPMTIGRSTGADLTVPLRDGKVTITL